MAWVQAGTRKINTANVCYMEQKDEALLIHFHGQWAGNPLELSATDAAAFWRHIKAEDVNAVKDKGSTMVVPKRVNTPMAPDLLDAAKAVADKPRIPSATPSGSPSIGQHSSSQHRPSSQPSSHAPSSPRPAGEVRKA